MSVPAELERGRPLHRLHCVVQHCGVPRLTTWMQSHAEPEAPTASSTVVRMLQKAERAVLICVAVVLLAAAIAVLAEAVYLMVYIGSHGVGETVVDALGELLLSVILLELAGTILTYLVRGNNDVRPFLIIGIVACIRQIVVVGAELALGTLSSHDEFIHAQVELAVSAGIALLLSASLALVSKRKAPNPEVTETYSD
jgi:phosphate starvation-inducible membrane PsiE